MSLACKYENVKPWDLSYTDKTHAHPEDAELAGLSRIARWRFHQEVDEPKGSSDLMESAAEIAFEELEKQFSKALLRDLHHRIKECQKSLELIASNITNPIDIDPFNIHLDQFRQLEVEDIISLQEKVRDLLRTSLEDSWQRGKKIVVVIDGKIYFESENQFIPDDVLKRLKKQKKAFYTFSAPDFVEESPWFAVASTPTDDYYPTIPLYINGESSDPSKIDTAIELIADFDTGNPELKALNRKDVESLLTAEDKLYLIGGTHLKKSYSYVSKTLRILVKDVQGNIRSITDKVVVVFDWEKGAFLQANANRTAFVGRDLLRKLKLRIELDPVTKKSRIYCL